MGKQTTIIEEQEDRFDGASGEITKQTHRRIVKKNIEKTDEYIKVSKYLNVIFAYNDIPLRLVLIALVIAQRMQFKTNIVYLLKDDKAEIAKLLDISVKRVESLIMDLKAYDIIRTISRGKYEVNSFLFSTGNIVETRELQAHFDFDADSYYATAEQKNLLSGEKVRKSIASHNSEKAQGSKQLTATDTYGAENAAE